MMLQQETPDDFVIGMGESHSVREFVSEAFAYVGLDWEEHVEIDPRYFRPLEVEALLADPSKARDVLGWQPKVTFADLVKIMMDSDLQAVGLAAVAAVTPADPRPSTPCGHSALERTDSPRSALAPEPLRPVGAER